MKKIFPLSLMVAVSLSAITYTYFNNTAPSAISENKPENNDWYSTVTSEITFSEYYFKSGMANQFMAVNRANNLRFQINSKGMYIQQRANSTWQATLKLNSIFAGNENLYADKLQSVKNDNDILTYQFNNYSIEYMNSNEGLRQNFIIDKNPDGNNKILKINMQVISSDKNALRNENKFVIKQNGQDKFYYADIKALDAHGKSLPARMELQNDMLSLIVDANNALFPVTIDPMSTTPEWSIESNQVQGNMGFAVSAAGDVNNDGFADVVIGACAYDEGEVDEGKAYLFLGSATGLSTTAIWSATSNNANGLMGKSVAAAGDVNGDGYDDLLVAAGLYSGTYANEGKAYLYYGTSTGVTTDPVWTLLGGQEDAGMGFPLEGLGDVNNDGYADVIIGVNGYSNGEEGEGRAYAFYGSSSGLASTPDWTVESNNDNAALGHAASAAGDVNGDGYDDAIVGGWNYSGVLAYSGKAWVYLGSATGLSATPVWQMEGPQTNDYYGFWASGVGDVNKDGYADIMVGAKRYDGEVADEGKAWLYLGSASGPSTTAAWTKEGDNAEAEYAIQFGPAGDVNGDGIDDVIMGAHFYTNTLNKEGAAYIYLGTLSGLSTTPYWTTYGGNSQANLGWSCDGAGDINNDGYDDVVVGAFKYSDPENSEGAAFVYYGATNCSAPTAYSVGTITSTTANVSWATVPAATSYKITAKRSGETKIFFTTSTPYTMSGLTPNKNYKSWIQAKCGTAWSMRSNVIHINTPPMRLGAQTAEDILIYPNPATNWLNIETSTLENSSAIITVYDMNGKIISQNNYDATDNAGKISVDINQLSRGMYFYTIQTEKSLYKGNFIKQ